MGGRSGKWSWVSKLIQIVLGGALAILIARIVYDNYLPSKENLEIPKKVYFSFYDVEQRFPNNHSQFEGFVCNHTDKTVQSAEILIESATTIDTAYAMKDSINHASVHEISKNPDNGKIRTAVNLDSIAIAPGDSLLVLVFTEKDNSYGIIGTRSADQVNGMGNSLASSHKPHYSAESEVESIDYWVWFWVIVVATVIGIIAWLSSKVYRIEKELRKIPVNPAGRTDTEGSDPKSSEPIGGESNDT